ncbi:hypothetical protein [Mediterraneibacter sp. ICN-202921]|uniref:hypothetical protein n=1 Tax=Mediterraneibacter sp. ICN-202921 TaxID=3134657 RepID=UPI0030C4165C
MFEHFGLKDLFVGLWKYKLIWIIVGIISGMGILGIGILEKRETVKIESGQPEEEIKRYEASRVFTFSMEGKASNDLVVLYKEITASDECKEYVFTKLLDEIEIEELKKKLLLGKIDDANVNSSLLNNYVSYETLGKQRAATLKIFTPDSEISEKIRDLYFEYYQKSAEESGIVEFSFLTDGNTKYIYKEIFRENQYSAIKTKVVLLFLGIWFLSFVSIFVYILFNPTLNRKTDFSEYDIEFLGEFPIKRNRR